MTGCHGQRRLRASDTSLPYNLVCAPLVLLANVSRMEFICMQRQDLMKTDGNNMNGRTSLASHVNIWRARSILFPVHIECLVTRTCWVRDTLSTFLHSSGCGVYYTVLIRSMSAILIRSSGYLGIKSEHRIHILSACCLVTIPSTREKRGWWHNENRWLILRADVGEQSSCEWGERRGVKDNSGKITSGDCISCLSRLLVSCYLEDSFVSVSSCSDILSLRVNAGSTCLSLFRCSGFLAI